VLVAVLTVTTRTKPSRPAWTSTIRPNGHFAGGYRSSHKRTICPMHTLLVVTRHFPRFCKCWRYSDNHFLQNWLRILCIHWNQFKWSFGIRTPSVSEIIPEGSPIQKCAGVKTFKSSGSEVSGHKEGELRHASISARTVLSSSKVKVWAWNARFRWYFTDLTPASHRPP
jgi:hypothetical protein